MSIMGKKSRKAGLAPGGVFHRLEPVLFRFRGSGSRVGKHGFPLLALVLSFPFFLVSCYEPVELELDDMPPVLVVDGAVTTEWGHHKVRLSRSTPYFDTAFSHWGVSGAEVRVSDGENSFDFEEDAKEKGLYRSRTAFMGEAGKTYELEVWVSLEEGGERQFYSARETMPESIRMDSITAVYGFSKPPLYRRKRVGWSILLYGTDSPAKNYYGIALYLGGRNYNDSLRTMRLWDDQIGSGFHLNGLPLFFFRSDTERHIAHAGMDVEMVVRNYTAEYYQYIQDVRAVVSPQVPVFSGAPSNCRGNVSGGAFGYFAVFSVDRKSTWLDSRDSVAWRADPHSSE